jgi:hypothetical protein
MKTEPNKAQESKRLRFTLGDGLSPELLQRVEEVFHGENLLQIILHAHLLIERAMTSKILTKLSRPEILEDERYGRWSFHQKLALYVGLCNPPKDREQLLFGFNRLRNMIAHRFNDEAECVVRCLPWEGEDMPRPCAHDHVLTVTLILLFELGAVKSLQRLTGDPIVDNRIHEVFQMAQSGSNENHPKSE